MLGKNIRFYRLKNNLSMRELASKINISPMTISYYERDSRNPGIETLRALAGALGVKISDFLKDQGTKLVFAHGEFRKNTRLTQTRQEYIRGAVEEYFGRFFEAVNVLGNKILEDCPPLHSIPLSNDDEKNAEALRHYLNVQLHGPVGNIVESLEYQGILVFSLNIKEDDFSGMNGTVNGRPYIVFRSGMNAERVRSTIIHEAAHFVFDWPSDMPEKECENRATAISGAFLFPAADAVKELGQKRSRVTHDMLSICREYGISMYLLVKRASICEILGESAAKDFYVRASSAKWRKGGEPERIVKEEPSLFRRLVYGAVCEGSISIQKGAELLQESYDSVKLQCSAAVGG